MNTNLIDGFTVFAQIINFLILLYLLRRFLYKPITRVMDERQRQMAERWQAAHDQQQAAQQQAETLRRRQEALEKRRSHLLAQAQEDAEAKHRQMVHQARQEVDDLQAQWQSALERQQSQFLASLRRQMADRTVDLTRRILTEVVDTSLEQQAVSVFERRLRQLEEPQRQRMQAAIRQTEAPVVIRTGIPLAEEWQRSLVQTVQRQLAEGVELMPLPAPADAEQNGHHPKSEETLETALENLTDYQTGVRFITSPSLICGVALQAAGQEVGWSIHHYLQDIQGQFAAQIQSEIHRGKGPAPAEEEEDRALDQLQQRLFHQTCAIARHALKDLADERLEERTIAVFLRQLETASPADYDLSSLAADPVTLRSSFPIDDSQRHRIIGCLRDRGFLPEGTAHQPPEEAIRFTTRDDLICGIELQVGEQTLSWSLDDYLRQLEQSLESTL